MTTGYRRAASGTHPPNRTPAYASTALRAPLMPPVRIVNTLSEITGPRPYPEVVRGASADMTAYNGGVAIGERIIVAGRLIDEDGRGLDGALIELWQANAAGRYAHPTDQHDAPLDPHFSGSAHLRTGADGAYRFVTIKPGAYPWQNHPNAWRPRHIHFSIFGPGFATRLVTQMYFPGDPLLAFDPIYGSVPDRAARERLIAVFDLALTEPGRALGYRFDIVLRGREATPQQG